MKPNQDNDIVLAFWNNPKDKNAKRDFLNLRKREVQEHKDSAPSALLIKICDDKLKEIEQELKDLGK